ncbi:MAG: adenosine deaminase [Alphaproteobacteria bacterium]|nr:adenosine deaminase [Alphaproteobacteria bacterium]
MDDRDALIAALPKAELHIHIEGSLEPEMMFQLAARNGLGLPYADVAALRAAYAFTRLQDFLDLYYQGMQVLRREQDYFDLAMAYFRRSARQGLGYAEIFFDPQGHTSRGVAFATVLGGLMRAQAVARAELGIGSRLIMCILRHLDEADAERTLDLALAHRDAIVGIGLDSSEVGHPPAKFRRVFRRAREAGFRLVAHAGEEGPPAYVWEALDLLGVERIDHGNRALEDAALVQRIARDRVPVTVCPLSNLRLCVVGDLAAHPLKRMLDLGLCATVNSDDPAYFGGYVGDNFRAAAAALPLGADDLARLARNGFEASFAAEAEKAAMLAEFDRRVGRS